jgi:hypothetical protein
LWPRSAGTGTPIKPEPGGVLDRLNPGIRGVDLAESNPIGFRFDANVEIVPPKRDRRGAAIRSVIGLEVAEESSRFGYAVRVNRCVLRGLTIALYPAAARIDSRGH